MILKDSSILLSLVCALVMFLFLFESRYSKRKTMIITLVTMVPLILVNLLLSIFMNIEGYGTLMLLTLSVPSCAIFWWMAKHRDGRFFFTFCMVDTVVLEIVYITNIINHYTTPDTNLVMFVGRVLLCLVTAFLAYRYLRPMYRKVQSYAVRGWGLFALIGALFYVAITLMMTYPVPVTERTHQLPALCLLFLLMPVIYLHIIATLRNQQKTHDVEHQESILKLQVDSLKGRLDAFSAADEKFRLERHDFRHKLQTVAALAQKQEYDQLRQLVQEYSDAIGQLRVERYCSFAVLDAALAVYAQKAKQRNIPISVKLVLPDSLPVSEAELATVLANALENAVNACEKVPKEKTYIHVQAICTPRLMIRITNSCAGNILFDENHIPVNYEEGHGFGTRSIVAFCEKYGVFYEFKATDDSFSLQLIFG